MHDFSHGDLFCDGRERVGSVAGFKNVVFLSVFGVVRGLVSFLVSLVSALRFLEVSASPWRFSPFSLFALIRAPLEFRIFDFSLRERFLAGEVHLAE